MKADGSSTSSTVIPAAAKAASEAAVRAAMAENSVEAVNGPATATTTATGSAGEEGAPATADEGQSKVVESEAAGKAEGNADELVTVFNDKENFNVIHPLYSSWSVVIDLFGLKRETLKSEMSFLRTLWFDSATKASKSKDWNELLQKVMEIASVEEFWG
jgi:translation initiation factor 4E